MSRAMLIAAGAALLGGARCTSLAPPYGLSPPPPKPDASADTADAAQGEKAGDANADDESRGEDATDGVDR